MMMWILHGVTHWSAICPEVNGLCPWLCLHASLIQVSFKLNLNSTDDSFCSFSSVMDFVAAAI